MYKSTLCALLMYAFSFSSLAQVPDSLAIQGCLADGLGDPVADDSYSVIFGLYDSPDDYVALWTETKDVQTNGCVFETYLGSVNPLSHVAFDRPMWLGIKVESDPPIEPRTPLTGVPYAMSLRNLRIVPAEDEDYEGVNVIGGAAFNTATEGVVGATISGGGVLRKSHSLEQPNVVSANFGTVGGGRNNIAGSSATVGGGGGNQATGGYSTIGGGNACEASQLYSTTGGGTGNSALGIYATVGGGIQNTATGGAATVPGGFDNLAQGSWSFAAGRHAKALHNGTFVWADRTDTDFESTAVDQFLIRATGGVGINTNAPSEALEVAGNVLANNIELPSDARYKKNISPLDGALAAVLQLQGVQYSWKTEEYPDHHFDSDEQIGFIAQEVQKVLPRIVNRRADGRLSLSYQQIIPVLVEAIKEQQAEIETLREVVDGLRSER